jgi:2'-5' RNA ligase
MSIYKALNIALIPGGLEMAALRQYANKLQTPYWHWHPEAIPHITLWMGIVKQEDVQTLAKLIRPLFQIGTLQMAGYAVVSNPDSTKNVVSCNVQLSPELFMLHSKIGKLFGQFRCEVPARKEMFYGEGISESTLHYFSSFSEKHTNSNYSPHITLGMAESATLPENSPIISEIALAKAGIYAVSNGCTCVNPQIEFNF